MLNRLHVLLTVASRLLRAVPDLHVLFGRNMFFECDLTFH
jgi:hypothetical protein